MGWSEKYWEDVESELAPELEEPAVEPGPASEDETLGQPAASQPAETPEKD